MRAETFAEAYQSAIYKAAGMAFVLSEHRTGTVLFGGRKFAIITAHNPRSERLSSAENQKRHEALERDLIQLGLEHTPSTGESPDGSWVEEGFVVFDIELEQALELGRKYGRHAVVYGEGERVALVWCETGRLESFYPEASVKSIREAIKRLVLGIKPLDSLESSHIQDALQWLESGEPIFRIEKPDIPPKHLVSYFALFDKDHQKILLVEHKKAGLWLPSGGHVEPLEHPKTTVEREISEELGLKASFVDPNPLFITVTPTVGATSGHTDVSLWYVLNGDCSYLPSFDKEEFHSVKWFLLHEIPYEKSDPQMSRFVQKLSAL